MASDVAPEAQPATRSGLLLGKSAVVTGAAKGIGRATTELFAAEGASLVACDVDADGLPSERCQAGVPDQRSAKLGGRAGSSSERDRDPGEPFRGADLGGRGSALSRTGAILAAVETATSVTATVLGKPTSHKFEIARQTLGPRTRVAVVGDHLVSDIAGAKRAGLDAILVLSGSAAEDELPRAPIQDLVLPSLAALAFRACRP